MNNVFDPRTTAWVAYDLSPAEHETAIRNKLIELGWTPPGEAKKESNDILYGHCEGLYTGDRGEIRAQLRAVKGHPVHGDMSVAYTSTVHSVDYDSLGVVCRIVTRNNVYRRA